MIEQAGDGAGQTFNGYMSRQEVENVKATRGSDLIDLYAIARPIRAGESRTHPKWRKEGRAC
jgi:hypothetical protein